MRRISSLSPVTLSVEQTKNESQRFLEQRRRAFIIVGLVGIVMLSYSTFLIVEETSLAKTVLVVNNIMFALASSVLVVLAFLRKTTMDALERAVFGLVAFQSLVFNSLSPWWMNVDLEWMYAETITDDVWFLVFVCTLALHIFPRRVGSAWASGLFLVSILAVGTRLAVLTRTEADWKLTGVVLQSYGFGTMMLCFMFVLARYREHGQRLSLEYQILERVAFLDALTGLPNRRRMYELTRQSLEAAEQFPTPFCVALLDLDFFKRINDTFGHLSGDQALIRVANILRAELGERYPIGRWGGEEFLVLFPNTRLEDAHTTLERVRKTLEHSVGLEGERITVSGGVAAYRAEDTSTTLVGRADLALYQAKNTGRNRILIEGHELLERV